MTKGRAYRIVWSAAGIGWSTAFTLVGLGIAFGIEPLMTAAIIILITSIVWVGLPLLTIVESKMPDPQGDRREEELEMLKAALQALKQEILGPAREGDEYALSVWRSCRERARRGSPYLPTWWDY